jgi:hypothetical protein
MFQQLIHIAPRDFFEDFVRDLPPPLAEKLF